MPNPGDTRVNPNSENCFFFCYDDGFFCSITSSIEHVVCGECRTCMPMTEMETHAEQCCADWFVYKNEPPGGWLDEKQHFDAHGRCDRCHKDGPFDDHSACTQCPDDSTSCLGCKTFCDTKKCEGFDCTNRDEDVSEDCPFCAPCRNAREADFRCTSDRCDCHGVWHRGKFVCALDT